MSIFLSPWFCPFQERHNAKTVGEIKQFVSQLPHMQAARGSLANHTSIAELIKDVTSEYPGMRFAWAASQTYPVSARWPWAPA